MKPYHRPKNRGLALDWLLRRITKVSYSPQQQVGVFFVVVVIHNKSYCYYCKSIQQVSCCGFPKYLFTMAAPAVLANCVFVIDKSIPLKKKVELIKMIKANGGASVYSVSPKVLCAWLFVKPYPNTQATHLITTQEAHSTNSAKVDTAKKLGVHIVSKEFVVDSITKGTRVDEEQYYFSDQVSTTTQC